jgi:hypothetical protein
VVNHGERESIEDLEVGAGAQWLRRSLAGMCKLAYAQELGIARPPEMNTHFGTPKILR